MFQTTREHSWLMNIYHHNVPNSFATTVAEEIYQNGLIPSDTDFTNFRRFAPNVAAYDFAHAYNAYAYHTKNGEIQLGFYFNDFISIVYFRCNVGY